MSSLLFRVSWRERVKKGRTDTGWSWRNSSNITTPVGFLEVSENQLNQPQTAKLPGHRRQRVSQWFKRNLQQIWPGVSQQHHPCSLPWNNSNLSIPHCHLSSTVIISLSPSLSILPINTSPHQPSSPIHSFCQTIPCCTLSFGTLQGRNQRRKIREWRLQVLME